jgi:hypothetical protein
MMSNSTDGSQNMSRRMALTSTALAFVVAAADAAITPAGAQQKISQAVAKYQDQPKGKQSCAVCVNFQPPNACKFVQGTISPNGWCQLFAAKT